MSSIVIFGSSGHARVVIDIVEKEGRHQIKGLLDDHVAPGIVSFGHQVLGNANELPALVARGITGILIAVGDNGIRAVLAARCRAIATAVKFVTAIHPSAELARGVSIGAGSVVMAGAVINSNAAIGEHCIVNTNASLDHDSVMGDYSCLMPAATVAGGVNLGAYAMVAMGAMVVQGVTIGEHAVVGAGATVLHDVPPRVVAFGTPARVVRPRNPGDPYL